MHLNSALEHVSKVDPTFILETFGPTFLYDCYSYRFDTHSYAKAIVLFKHFCLALTAHWMGRQQDAVLDFER